MSRLLPLLALAVALPLSAQSLPDWAAPTMDMTPPPSDPGGPGSDPGTPGGSPPTQSVPIDGGLGLLALAGGAYAVRRLRSKE